MNTGKTSFREIRERCEAEARARRIREAAGEPTREKAFEKAFEAAGAAGSLKTPADAAKLLDGNAKKLDAIGRALPPKAAEAFGKIRKAAEDYAAGALAESSGQAKLVGVCLAVITWLLGLDATWTVAALSPVIAPVLEKVAAGMSALLDESAEEEAESRKARLRDLLPEMFKADPERMSVEWKAGEGGLLVRTPDGDWEEAWAREASEEDFDRVFDEYSEFAAGMGEEFYAKALPMDQARVFVVDEAPSTGERLLVLVDASRPDAGFYGRYEADGGLRAWFEKHYLPE